MKQEDKELLFRDLCARLPYKTKIQLTEYSDLNGEKLPSKIKTLDYCMLGRAQAYCKGFRKDKIKPYLFPLSSITDEQEEELKNIYYSFFGMFNYTERIFDKVPFKEMKYFPYQIEEFFNKNHLDYRRLIPKGLAIDATGLNIYKEETK